MPSTQRDATSGLDPTLQPTVDATSPETSDEASGGWNVRLRTSEQGDWVAIYVDNVKQDEGHSLSSAMVLDALGIPYTSEVMELDDIGGMPDGSDPFPETL